MSNEPSSAVNGYFRFGPGSICYGHFHAQKASPVPTDALLDAYSDVTIKDGQAFLPFDPSQVLRNLRHEVYVEEWRHGLFSTLSRIYYFLRPGLPVGVRKYLQMFYLKDWKKIGFPSWPVDCSIDNLMERLMLLSLRASGESRIPIIWYWPDAHSSCAIMTHDVETRAGFEYCRTLMEIDDSFGIKSSFQIIPEERYKAGSDFLEEIRRRGFEICVHDLNHDGHLYKNHEQFLKRATKINEYGKEFKAEGFRAAVLYRKQLWYDALKFSYDMSVPNVAHLDPQRGGCCTVMPFFFENGILEIPVTTVQDYSLYNILHDYSISLWKQQADIIMGKHGCMNFIVHPDYAMEPRQVSVYKELLGYLDQLRRDNNVWITTPGEVNRWWRQRSAMTLIEEGGRWRIEGEGHERARIAWASEKDGELVLSLEDPSPGRRLPTGSIAPKVTRRESSSSGI